MKKLIWSAAGIVIVAGLIYFIKSKTDKMDEIPTKYPYLHKRLQRVK